jgi:hypothetical protein
VLKSVEKESRFWMGENEDKSRSHCPECGRLFYLYYLLRRRR